MEAAAFTEERLKYLRLLAERYPSIRAASTEIIHLEAILDLPKGTEHFISDVHGEYEPFRHVMKNASGVIRNYVRELFSGTMTEAQQRGLATLVYYPTEKLALVKKTETDLPDWYRVTLFKLVVLFKRASSKYTRSKVRKAIDPRFSYILEELLHEDATDETKQHYYARIIDSIVQTGCADDYIVEICRVVQRLAIDRLHIIGDIFDRGPGADRIMDELMRHHSLDIQWGNHDILWLGAAAGSLACMLNVIRISARYTNLHILEEGYGINLVPLASYAIEHYSGCDCSLFLPEGAPAGALPKKEAQLIAQMHKAVTILQFKAEAQVIARHPEYAMDDRLLLDKIDFDARAVRLGDASYPLIDCDFPTLDRAAPLRFTAEEEFILDKLCSSFQNAEKLRAHAELLLARGGMYKVFNGNLLFHGCIPMDADGSFRAVRVGDAEHSGRALLDAMEKQVRAGYLNLDDPAAMRDGQDMMWYLWCGPDSPLYGKEQMTTFERYFVADKDTHAEPKDPYYLLRDQADVCVRILLDFGLDPESGHVVNGHVPVQVSKGESPIKADGKLFVIDGGFAKAYQKITGIAGYTLIYNSHGLILVSHEPFESTQAAIEGETDVHSSQFVIESTARRIKVAETDVGAELREDICDLTALLTAYRQGLIPES